MPLANFNGHSLRKSSFHQTRHLKSSCSEKMIDASVNYMKDNIEIPYENLEVKIMNSTKGRYSPHPHELFVHPTKLSVQSLNQYNDSIACCLTPPSPAPTQINDTLYQQTPTILSMAKTREKSDNLVETNFQIASTLVKPYLTKEVSSDSCAVIPEIHTKCSAFSKKPNFVNSDLSNTKLSYGVNSFSSSDVYISGTKASAKCTNRYEQMHMRSTSPSNFSSNNNNNHLAVNVHTPVKRYVPTPPLHTASPPMPQQQPQIVHKQYQTTAQTYRIQLKCCSELQKNHVEQQQQKPILNHESLIQRPFHNLTLNGKSCPTLLHEQKKFKDLDTNVASTLKSPSAIIHCMNINTNTNSSISTLNSTDRVGFLPANSNSTSTTFPFMTSYILNNIPPEKSCITENVTQNNFHNKKTQIQQHQEHQQTIFNGSQFSESCLHCNTVRRKTGVHRTTQTTGPLSPISISQTEKNLAITNTNNSIFCSQGKHQYLHNQTSVNNIEKCENDDYDKDNSYIHSQKEHMNYLSQQPQSLTVSNHYVNRFNRVSLENVSENIYENCLLHKAQSQHMKIQQQSISTLNSFQVNTPLMQSYAVQDQNIIKQNGRLQNESPTSKSASRSSISDSANFTCNDTNNINISTTNINKHDTALSAPISSNFINTANVNSSLSTSTITSPETIQRTSFNNYIKKNVANFFGVEKNSESSNLYIWKDRQYRFALRKFGYMKSDFHTSYFPNISDNNTRYPNSERPDILPMNDSNQLDHGTSQQNSEFCTQYFNDYKISVSTILLSIIPYIIEKLYTNQSNNKPELHKEWSRSFPPLELLSKVSQHTEEKITEFRDIKIDISSELFFNYKRDFMNDRERGGLSRVQHRLSDAEEVEENSSEGRRENDSVVSYMQNNSENGTNFIGDRCLQGWQLSGLRNQTSSNLRKQRAGHGNPPQTVESLNNSNLSTISRGTRISSHLLDGILENSRRPVPKYNHQIPILTFTNEQRIGNCHSDYRPFFTYWINTIHILILIISILCYGLAPFGLGFEQKTGQVLVTSLSLQTVQHTEPENFWFGLRNNDLVHLGAKFAACMRIDNKITNVILKTRRQERDTACCIRNDDSGCVQSSQADCSVRGLFPTKSISTWKKWSPGESGPGGRISGSVCGLDPKFCDAPASVAPFEWPDDITKWPICRKTNSVSQRYRFKDHAAEHMVCEVIGHPCCTGVFGECRITTKEYCEFINGYFHEEASLCSQVSCLNNICGMLPFMSEEVPDQMYRLFTSLFLHAGLIHLAITIFIQHLILTDLERLIGTIRMALLYLCSGIAGNLSSALLVPYKPEVGPSASLCGILGCFLVLLVQYHWKHLQKPHVALMKLLMLGGLLFAVGTLPWQINFIGLSVGTLSGAFLTFGLVPFISIGGYRRQSKINLILTCIVFHIIMFTFMMLTFYFYSNEVNYTKLSQVLGQNLDTMDPFIIKNNFIDNKGAKNVEKVFKNNNFDQTKQNSFEHFGHHRMYHHHQSDDIVSNSIFKVKN